MSDDKNENLDQLLDEAIIKYGEIQDQINNLPKDKVPAPVPRPPGAPDVSEQKNKSQLNSLVKQQQDLKEEVSQKADELSEGKTADEKQAIQDKVNEWKESDIYSRYNDLKALKENPVAISEPKFDSLVKEHKENAGSGKDFLSQKLNYSELNENKNLPEKGELKNEFNTMSDRFTSKLNYNELDNSKIGNDKFQKAKNFAENRDDITSKPETRETESKEVDIDKDE